MRVAESGVARRRRRRRLRDAGYDAVLVGETLVTAGDPAAIGAGACRVFVKICGITSEDDALLAVAMGADAVGFVFAPSPRQIAAGDRRATSSSGCRREILTVGVFRDEAPERVVEIVHHAGLRGAPSCTATRRAATRWWVRERVPFVIKAFAAGDRGARRPTDFGADVDPGRLAVARLGPGVRLALADGAPDGQRLILAGGLTPDNVGRRPSQRVRPWGVDVSTGVESSPGPQGPAQGAGLHRQRPRARRAAADYRGRRRRCPTTGRTSDATG